MLEKFAAYALGLRVGFVDFVDRDDHRRLGGARVIDRFDCLRFYAVISRDDQNDDVRHFGAARTHGGEGCVAGRIDEGHLGAGARRNLISADVLRDAAGLARNNVRLPDCVEQRSLAVVDVTHDGDDRRARHEVCRVVWRVEQTLDHVGFRDAAYRVAHLLGDELGSIRVNRVRNLQHLTLVHQQPDHIDAAFGHTVCELLKS